jgi:hypothetical protein
MTTLARSSQRHRRIVDDLRVGEIELASFSSRQHPVQLRSEMHAQAALRWNRCKLHIIILALSYSSYIAMQIATIARGTGLQ